MKWFGSVKLLAERIPPLLLLAALSVVHNPLNQLLHILNIIIKTFKKIFKNDRVEKLYVNVVKTVLNNFQVRNENMN